MSDLTAGVPSFVKVVGSFVGILALFRMRVPLGLAMVLCAVGLTFWTGASWAGLDYLLKSLLLPENFLLPAAIGSMLYLLDAMTKSGMMELTIGTLRARLRSARLLAGGLPALIGLLPIPGGALFSAPLVESVAPGPSISSAHKAVINYWFRHVWEYWWPLYPGVILAIRYSELPALSFFALQAVYTPIALAAGSYFLLRGVKLAGTQTKTGPGDMRTAGLTLLLIAIVVAGAMLGPPVLSSTLGASAGSIAGMIAGIAAAGFVVFVKNPAAAVLALGTFRSIKSWAMIAVVVGALVYAAALKAPLDSSGATVVTHMRDEFRDAGIPVVAIMMLLPFVAGIIMGVAMGFVGASFPLVLALLGPNPSVNAVAAATTLAYAMGYAGMMLSPVHICFVLTNQYFKTRLSQSYRYLWRPVAAVVVSSIVLAAAYHRFLKP